MTVLNKRASGVPQGAVYIGRPSKWGNPFEISKQHSRDDVVRLYRDWLFGQPELMESARRELRGKDLVCFCAPLKCHGDVLNEISNLGVTQMANNKGEDFLTPVMRLLQGNPFEAQTKDLTTGLPLTTKTGPNAGQPTQKFFIAVGGRKGDPEVEALKAQFDRVARAAFPQFFPGGGACTVPQFSWKIVDGDGYDDKGQPNNLKEGFAGHWVFRFSSTYAPKCYVREKYGPGEQLAIPPGGINPIPRGHYVRVSGTVSDNIPSNKPGLYANLGMVEWNAIGDLITSGPDAGAVFGGGAQARAAGTAFTMTAAAGAFTREQYHAVGHTDASLIAQGFMVQNAPAAAPAPAPAPAPAAPVPQPAAPAPAPAPTFTMLPAAGAFTREQYHAVGHTDESLIAQGFMVRNAPAAAPAPAPVAVAPHPGILTPAAPAPLAPAGSAPAPPPPAQIASAAPGFKMTNPVGPSYASYIAQGWTDAALIQNQLMVPA